ncbi:hypothetical protein A2U01_0090949, partial [Trifolium medium]|nr:hypothetical protein [Trifolium medium]
VRARCVALWRALRSLAGIVSDLGALRR